MKNDNSNEHFTDAGVKYDDIIRTTLKTAAIRFRVFIVPVEFQNNFFIVPKKMFHKTNTKPLIIRLRKM